LEKVFTIIVTYNGIAWISKCIESLLAGLSASSIVIVDNCSTDGTVSFIRVNYPRLHLICLGKNIGFGQANNIGIEYAKSKRAEYFFLLNQDACVEGDTVEKLFNSHKEKPAIGILSPLHLNGNGTDLDIYFRKYLQQSGLRGFLKNALVLREIRTSLIRTSFVNAAAWMISRDCLDKTGGFDPIFFHYGEDENYAQRIFYHGFEMAIHTGTRIFHDREQRIMKSPGNIIDLKKEWTRFLVLACDINRRDFIPFMVKRIFKGLGHASINFIAFNKMKLRLDLHMLRRILFSFFRIRASRLRSLRGGWSKEIEEYKIFVIQPLGRQMITPN
jgi:GT2 family glycosyltransferase